MAGIGIKSFPIGGHYILSRKEGLSPYRFIGYGKSPYFSSLVSIKNILNFVT